MNGPIPYVELYAPQEQWQENDSWAVRRVACSYKYRQQFVQNMLGATVTNGTRSSGLTRIVPASMLSGFAAEYNAPYGVTSGTEYNDEIKAAYTKWWATSAKFVEPKGVPMQGQTAGELVYANKPYTQMNLNGSTADYDSVSGDLKGTLTNWDSSSAGHGIGDAIYDITYRPMPFDILSDAVVDALDAPLNTCELSRYVQRFYQFGARVLAAPAGTTHWKDYLQAGIADAPIPEGAALKTLPYGTWQYKWWYVPTIPWANIWACYGKVNAAESGANAPDGRFDYIPSVGGASWVNGKQQGWLPGSLLFEGVSGVEQVTTASGQKLWNLTFAFRYLPGNNGATQDTHNKIFRFVDDDYYEIVTNYTPGKPSAQWKKLYQSATFSNLFKLSLFA